MLSTSRKARVGMLSAREKLLVEGQYDWVKLWDAHRHVAFENVSDPLAEVQRKTLALVAALIRDGLAEPGDLRYHGAHFEPWTSDLAESIERLSADYIDTFADRAGWPWTLWLRITDEGKRIGATHEAEYRRWSEALHEQGADEQALPLKFEPGA
ncbi:hypothetical protein ASE48_03900 [Mycobacterium sp. Root265]|uniref:hypothetical protein n=1 Tax=Mycobacterium sp. Root265 TaxID=1736504 RepID=UPI00070D465F|nr:hypothetical protein [Mycobacterium sp. Root265]KRD14173.1 hypothetical protein ASE48_03900 [Mycobacterium sp. Root265]